MRVGTGWETCRQLKSRLGGVLPRSPPRSPLRWTQAQNEELARSGTDVWLEAEPGGRYKETAGESMLQGSTACFPGLDSFTRQIILCSIQAVELARRLAMPGRDIMSPRSYWLDLFTRRTWEEFLNAGAQVSGFREGRWKTVQQLRPGDYLLCYVVGISRFIGVLEVTSEAFIDHAPIWDTDEFPCRVRVNVVVNVPVENAVPISQLRDKLSIFQHEHPIAWTGHLRGSPAKWKDADAEVILAALQERKTHPQHLPVSRPPDITKPLSAVELGPVIVPDREETNGAIKEPTLHTEVQWVLLKMGSDMGLDVWVARNDRSREVGSKRFADLPRLKRDLPLQFDEATTRTIELIDVLWLRGNAIVAAFEIECTTSIYSGLLRMSDLIAMQPNLKMPLYLVAPDERREKVITEVNRPTFSRLKPPMNEICRFISIPILRDRVNQAAPFVRHLKPEFIDEIAESCELEEV